MKKKDGKLVEIFFEEDVKSGYVSSEKGNNAGINS